MNLAALAHAVWEGDGAGAAVSRALLSPAERLFGAIVARRNARFDGGPLRPSVLPAISVGNLTVGGTGKTPVAAWCTRRLRTMGAFPSVVLRGYGDDEWRVHGLLNPEVPVIVTPDRTSALVAARAKGADCAVLDDAFQHRQAARVVDLVLLSADRWTGHVRLLPAGPFREPLQALARAHVVVVTSKAVVQSRVDEVDAAVRAAAPGVAIAHVRLVPGDLRLAAMLPAGGTRAAVRPADGAGLLRHAPQWLAGREVVAASAVGDPAAFEAQLRALGARLRDAVRFPDHHAYTSADAHRIARIAGGADVVCTLKDAVKLREHWPREAPPLWYVSQSVVIDRGAEALDRALARVLAARTVMAPTAG